MGLPLLIKLMKPQFAEQFLATGSLHFEMFEKFKQMEQEDNDTEMGDAHEATAIRKFNPDTTTFLYHLLIVMAIQPRSLRLSIRMQH
ncbi:hypothetical protein QMG96_10520 [Lactiplantibacillus plantarum]|uniref:hypothetical protein n=3 Tax=Lactiplantibacillus plantarum TaxID=1590 RepID=UPI0007B5535B|nr:hypothetical protein [Lactiplantibacillus plantarum]KZU72114.1 hypothetical protein Nizo2814_0165 [Lactiplantibacillus plantarum]MBS0951423.1 hypothetical protein [Lactiplantibacillus plantarum]MCG0555787.1 hypothetical protein [Lactiplantibacillus plantarum]MCG0815753.1 hypothetical protein [Lactiplantibacillus plantarum]MCG0818300.1 hypothetical protein [Lactiplantibacillus plantarum]